MHHAHGGELWPEVRSNSLGRHSYEPLRTGVQRDRKPHPQSDRSYDIAIAPRLLWPPTNRSCALYCGSFPFRTSIPDPMLSKPEGGPKWGHGHGGMAVT
eukprot:2321999-Rhodomonas_salina.4